MGELGAFLRLERVGFEKRDPRERVRDYRQYFSLPDDGGLRDQGARCMDCGVPFCHEGCPLGNLIPDWNDLVYRDKWRDALTKLHATNNFPEFTGLICPAPCESACVLDINDDPVTIEQIEFAYGVDVGRDVAADELLRRHDALIVAIGSRTHRDLDVAGRDLAGVHFAMEYLYQRNRAVAAAEGRPARETAAGNVISAAGKRLVVVGGGD